MREACAMKALLRASDYKSQGAGAWLSGARNEPRVWSITSMHREACMDASAPTVMEASPHSRSNLKSLPALGNSLR
ncbi:hypothetical protein AB1N83_013867 [Pleurotus pulmonarius]